MIVNNKQAKAVLFDLDDTLINHAEALEMAILEVHRSFPELGSTYSAADLVSAWKASLKTYYQDLTKERLPEHERRIRRVRSIWEKADCDLSDKACMEVMAMYLGTYKKNWQAHSDVIPMLERLKEFRLGVVTNGHIQQQNDKLRACEIDRHFEIVVTSEEVGSSKPSAAIFHHACKRLGVMPSETVFAGDLPDVDVFGAERAGLVGVWINRSGTERDASSTPKNSISSLLELDSILAIVG